MPYIGKILKRYRDYGLLRTICYGWYCLDDTVRFARAGIGPAIRTTRVFVPWEKSGLPSSDYTAHQPTTSYYAFRKIMNEFIVPDENDVFLDYGSGLGRVIMMAAATYRFRRIIGVEYSGDLCVRAERTIQSIRDRLSCRDITLVNADAKDFEVPGDVTVIYFYNPFGGDIMRKVCEQIRQSLIARPRRLRVVCFRPGIFEETVKGSDWLVKQAELHFPSISVDSFAVYRSIF